MTQIEEARRGNITKEMEEVATEEMLSPELIRDRLAEGTVVILKNKNHPHIKPLGVGFGLKTKVNANIGTSKDQMDPDEELNKLRVSIKYGADAVMDLSTGGDIDAIRRMILKETTVPIGTVPIYEAGIESLKAGAKGLWELDPERIFQVIERQCADGVDFITVHCGVTRETASILRREGRIMDVVSRGGSFLVEWMLHNKRENPLLEQYDRLCEIARKYDAVFSLGDGLRPGCLADATDRGQVAELLVLGELTQRAWKAGVQVMIEGPGHVPINQIEANVQLQKRVCHGAPFYVLGPLTTDIAPGYDHIVGSIGGAVASAAGADFLCYLTPAEHLRLPDADDVREGVIATKIAAHSGDIAKGIKGAFEQDRKLSIYRKKLNWGMQFKLAIDPEKPRQYRKENHPTESEPQVCTMCGDFCSYNIMNKSPELDFF